MGPSAKAKLKGKSLCSPSSRMSTRYQKQRQKEKEEKVRASFGKVRSTEELISRRPSSTSEPERSLSDVFASFSSADLVRGEISPRETFEEESLDNPRPSTSLGEPSTSQAAGNQANQSSILWPFSHFFGRDEPANRTDSLPDVPRDASTPKD